MQVKRHVPTIPLIIADLIIWIFFLDFKSLFFILLLQALLVVVFSILKVVLLKSQELDQPGWSGKKTKFSTVINVIFPQSLIGPFQGLVLALSLIPILSILSYLTTGGNMGEFNFYYIIGATIIFIIFETTQLIIFILSKEKSSKKILRSVEKTNLPIIFFVIIIFGLISQNFYPNIEWLGHVFMIIKIISDFYSF